MKSYGKTEDGGVLVLTQNAVFFSFPKNTYGCKFVNLYKHEGITHRILRKIVLNSSLPGEKLLFSHWYNMALKADVIILFDTGNMRGILKWLSSVFPEKRIIAWFWNSVHDTTDPNTIKFANVEKWSFDKSDCLLYKMNYNTQFYIPENMKKSECGVNTDVFYVGTDKNRAQTLFELNQELTQRNISFLINLVQYKDSQNRYGIEYKPPMQYCDVLGQLDHSKVVVDLVAEWQDGLTLRPLEAMLFKKKLITNYKNIKTYDFYSPNNIFIINEDDNDRLKDFVETPYDDSDNDKYVKMYSLQEWISRFIQ